MITVNVTKNIFGDLAKSIPSAIDNEERAAAQELASEWRNNIQAKGLVDTGAYLNSINASQDGDGWTVSSGVEYAVYLEYGTSRGIPAHGVMAAAADTVRATFAQRISKALGGGL